jgi:hypothetical protein
VVAGWCFGAEVEDADEPVWGGVAIACRWGGVFRRRASACAVGGAADLQLQVAPVAGVAAVPESVSTGEADGSGRLRSAGSADCAIDKDCAANGVRAARPIIHTRHSRVCVYLSVLTT